MPPRFRMGKQRRKPLHEGEWVIVDLICEGFTNEHIARTLKITERGVKSHLSNIFVKEGVNSRLDLAVKHWKMRYIDLQHAIDTAEDVVLPKPSGTGAKTRGRRKVTEFQGPKGVAR